MTKSKSLSSRSKLLSSSLNFGIALLIGIAVFHSVRHHWPSWDLIVYLTALWLTLGIVQIWRAKAVQRRHLGGNV